MKDCVICGSEIVGRKSKFVNWCSRDCYYKTKKGSKHKSNKDTPKTKIKDYMPELEYIPAKLKYQRLSYIHKKCEEVKRKNEKWNKDHTATPILIKKVTE